MAVDQELLDELQQQTTILRGMAGFRANNSTGSGGGVNFDEVRKASDNLAKSLYSSTKSASSSIMNFGESMKDAGSAVKWFAGLFGVAGLGGLIANSMDQYREFIKVGQTFSGSMSNMGRIAALTHQSLEDMYKGFRAGGQAAATLGVEQFSQLSSVVRDNIRNFGSFGLSINEVNNFMGDQIETLRLSGLLDSINRNRLAKDFAELQIQTTGLSAVTGRAREDILKQTMAFQQQNLAFRGYMAGVPDSIKGAVHDSLQNSINIFSSLPGELGKVLSSGLSEGLTFGSVYMSETFKDVALMAPNVANALDEVRAIAERGGDTTEASLATIEAFRDIGPDVISMLNMQAHSGNQAAAQVLEFATTLQGINMADYKEQARRAANFKPMEQAYLNFGQNMSVIFGEIKLLLFNAFKPAIEALAGPGGKGGILSDFADLIKGISGPEGPLYSFGKMLGDAITKWRETWPDQEVVKANIQAFLKSVIDSTTVVLKWTGILNEAGDLDFASLLGNVKSVIAALMEGLVGFLSFLDGIGVDISAESRQAISTAADKVSGKYTDEEIMAKHQSGKVLKSYESEATLGFYTEHDKEIVGKKIEEMIAAFLKDDELSTAERKELQKVMNENVALQKQSLDELRKQTGMQGESLDTIDKTLKVNKTIAQTSKQGGQGGY